jgi:uncharacterized OB-fold protein
MQDTGSEAVGASTLRPWQDYQRFLAEGRFMIQRSRASGRHIFYPRVAEPETGSTDLEWVEPSGRGTVYSVTIVRQRPPAADYNVVLVDLEEGPRMMSRVDGVASTEIRIGMRVNAKVVQQDGQPLVVFVPAQVSGEAPA